ncbi:inorganic phosphate transporter [Isoalcanivorax beigongshangi]|uniref:Phosphate transporter n=1 Tax=Isoalcanivorax beigongshangi TaxID=3238810 RepID=A0ABV4ADL6_9GAMM
MDIIIANSSTILVLACAFGFLMAWGIGANDVANAMGTSVGSRALTVKRAILIAIFFEAAGAYLAGGSVTETIRSGILENSVLEQSPDLLVFGMMASLLAAGVWLAIASAFGWPVSTTHSIVGAIVGFATVGIGFEVVQWGKMSGIVASWIISPLFSGVVAFLLFRSVQKLILSQPNPFQRAQRIVPVYMFLTGFMVAMMTFTKGLKHLGLNLSTGGSLGASVLAGLMIAGIGALLLRRIEAPAPTGQRSRFAGVEKIFAILMIFTACAMAFAHGSNDVANAVGPLAAIYGVLASGEGIGANTAVPNWILLLGATGIVVGLATLGVKVMRTIGTRITELTPSRGFAAELGAASTVVIASGIGLPISTTHALVGAVLGVGMARGISALNLSVISTIFTSWIVTLPAGAGLSILFFYIITAAFGV